MAITREDIEALKKKPKEELTPQERGLANLTPYKPGQSGNPAGKKKGCKNWATHFQKLMGDPEFMHKIIKNAPKDWLDLVGDTPADVIAGGIIATVMKGVDKSFKTGKLNQETQEQIKLLNKLGYGDKVVHDAADEAGFFIQPVIKYEVVPDRTDIKKVEPDDSNENQQ